MGDGDGSDLATMAELVSRFFVDPETAVVRYAPPRGASVAGQLTELIPGLMYGCDLVDKGGLPVRVQLYRGVSDIGGHLWEQELRVLFRFDSLDHPALPKIVAGGHKSEQECREAGFDIGGFAYVSTKGSPLSLADRKVEAELRQHPVLAVRQFLMVADALSILHQQQILHRHLWPGSLKIHLDPETMEGTDRIQVKLARFEMSLLLGNLLRTAGRSAAAEKDRARLLLLNQEGHSVAYSAAERFGYLKAGVDGQSYDTTQSDVFGLGASVAGWFVADLPEPPDAQADGLPDLDLILRWHDDLRAAVGSVDNGLPPELRALLISMLARHAKSRPTAGQVVDAIAENYESITAVWAGPNDHDQPYLVTFMPKQSQATIGAWGLIRHDTEEAEGRLELAAFIEDDLRGGRLHYAPFGAEPYLRGGQKEYQRDARYLLLGGQIAWFCQRYRATSPISGKVSGPYEDDILMIKYVIDLGSKTGLALLEDLKRGGPARTVPAVKAVPDDLEHLNSAEFAALREDRPDWKAFIELTRPHHGPSPEDLMYGQAFEWLLRYQTVELDAREYPYELVDDSTSHLRLRHDQKRDQARQHENAMASLYANSTFRRPPFGDFFVGLAEEEPATRFQVLPDYKGAPDIRNPCGVVYLKNGHGQEAISVTRDDEEMKLPPKGWIRPADDVGSRVALRRQFEGQWDVLRNRQLLRQLRAPSTIRGLKDDWKGEVGNEVATDMLSCEPFYALHGPPGTGKTEVASRAVAAYLGHDVARRVLVSAQSNFALDNLARRLLDLLGAEGGPLETGQVVALRVQSRRADQPVDEQVSQFTPYLMAGRLAERLHEHAEGMTWHGPNRKELAEQWCQVSANCVPELADRLRRAANLVFATCSTAGSAVAAPGGGQDLFDWVLIEEAAKAWPTELAIPLGCGLRWTLIGDHKQLSAHRAREVETFLEECARRAEEDPDDEDAGVVLPGGRHKDYLKVFHLFASLFLYAEEWDGKKEELPVRQLTTQYRMNRNIGELVSRVFYPVEGSSEGLLGYGKKADEPHGLTSPALLTDRSVVWLDTQGVTGCAQEGGWVNRGEVEIVSRLVTGMRPVPSPGENGLTKEPLVVLTPYRKQAELMRKRPALKPYVSTIHAFQGKEADIVVVSLVRDKERGPTEKPWQNIGHLTQKDLVNVMCSRARRLLVIVGNFQHFAACGVPFWEDLCRIAGERGYRAPAGRVLR